MAQTITAFKEVELNFFDTEIREIVDQKDPELWPELIAAADPTPEKAVLFRFLGQLTMTPHDNEKIYYLMLQKTYSILSNENSTFSEETQDIYNHAKIILEKSSSFLQSARDNQKSRVFSCLNENRGEDHSPPLFGVVSSPGRSDVLSSPGRPDIDHFLERSDRSPTKNNQLRKNFLLTNLPSDLSVVKEIPIGKEQNFFPFLFNSNSQTSFPDISFQKTPSYTEYGEGIENGGNSCYMNSILQALRFIPFFITAIKADEKPNKFMKMIIDIYNILEGKSNNKKETLSKGRINDFRNYCLEEGFRQDVFEGFGMDWATLKVNLEGFIHPRETTQEDAQEFYQFLSYGLKLPRICYKITSTYTFPVPISYLDRQKQEKQYTILLKPSKRASTSTIQELLDNNIVEEFIDAKAILSAENSTFTEDQKKELEIQNGKAIKTTQQVQLHQDTPPPFVTITVNRYASHTRQSSLKEQISVAPSDTISLHIFGNPTQVTYKLTAIVVHTGATYESGHNRAYVPMSIDNKETWLEFDDETVIRYNEPKTEKRGFTQQTPYEDATQNGYLYFYVQQNS